ncbi:voltage-gated purine nucleotide uniporter SLC17A9 isoform X5 [Mustela lutreola]|uniref:voltage-gated purine nucleotide uniporter SLC17A9 isoform X5 n=1 Tax=Mustela lutreola TaxID=9666 RepID=UPI002797012E|nr:voltage-gated purine nucleotide uniporter SLC17A9 isoform X5 [Mustela lutreola]
MQPQPLPLEEARGDGAENTQWSRPECQTWTATLLLGTCLLYCARVSVPVCTVSMSQDFGWNKKEAGLVLSSFFWGYCLTQVVGGHLGDRRVLSGADQPAVPEGARERASVHLQHRGGRLPVWDAGDRGRGLPPPGPVRLAKCLLLLGWPHAAVGVLRVQVPTEWKRYRGQTSSWPWASWRKACRCPGTPKFPGDSFSGSLQSGQPSPPSCRRPAPSSSSCPGFPPSFRRRSPAPRAGSSTWCLGWWRFPPVCSAGFCLIILSIRPRRLGPSRGRQGLSTNGPTGPSPRLPRSGYRTITVRKFMQVMGLGLSSVFALCLGHTSSFCTSVVFASASIGLQTFNHSGISVNIQDLAPSCAGFLFGVANTAGALAGVVGVCLGGYLLETTGSWASMFNLVAAVGSLGLCTFLLFGEAQRVDLSPAHEDL